MELVLTNKINHMTIEQLIIELSKYDKNANVLIGITSDYMASYDINGVSEIDKMTIEIQIDNE